jgi:anti-sigma B factor antagonist
MDCTDLDFISSSGLRLFLALRKETIAKGGSITIKGVSPEIKQVFTITGFYSLFIFE